MRYTYVIEPNQYAEKVAELQQTLVKQGFVEKDLRNSWGNETGYKGVNARYETAEGQRIEIQFHTLEASRPNKRPTPTTKSNATTPEARGTRGRQTTR